MDAMTRYARPSPDYATKVGATLELLREADAEFGPRVLLSTSMGAEDMVLIDLIAADQLPIPMATLDTGALHPQTVTLLQHAQRHYARSIDVFRPDADAVIAFVARHGADAMRRSVEQRHACCALRKLEPLQRMLQGRLAWITGLRREQSAQRQAVEPREIDAQGRIKFNPLADWTRGDVWHYIASHRVPYNPLHDAFYPSIGCAPCTRAVTPGEDERSGRWWWESDSARECGLHLSPEHPSETHDEQRR